MLPVWTLKLGALGLTLASTAGFWHYVSGHAKPVRAPLHPRVVQVTEQDMQWQYDPNDPANARPTAGSAGPVVVQQVPAPNTQARVQDQASIGAAWIANRTGQKPVTITYVS